MKDCPTLWTLKELLTSVNETQVEIGGRWLPARPIGYRGLFLLERFRIALKVFIGQADAVIWPGKQ